MELARLGRLSFFQGIPSWALIRLAEAATEEELPAPAGCEEPSRLARVPATAFEEVFERDPALAYQILQRVATSVANRLEQTRERLCPPPSSHRWRGQAMSAETLELLAGSPFFEGFDPQDLAELAGHARMIAFQAAERVFAEAEPATALFLLVSGAVELSFATQADQEGPGLAGRTITHVGHPIGGSALVGQPLGGPRWVRGGAARPGPSWSACVAKERDRNPAQRDLPAAQAPLLPPAPAHDRRRLPHPGPAPAPRRPGRAQPRRALRGRPGAGAPGAPPVPAAPGDLSGGRRRAFDDGPGRGPAAQHARVPPAVCWHPPPDRRIRAAAGTAWPHRHHEPPG